MFLLLSASTLYFMFPRPVYSFALSDPSNSKSVDQSVAEPQDCLALLSSAGQRLGEITVDQPDFYNRVIDLHNASRRVLETYIPDLTEASTSPQIKELLIAVNFQWLQEQLSGVYNVFQTCENYLYEADLKGIPQFSSEEFGSWAWAAMMAKEYSSKLQPRNIVWQKRLYVFRQKIDHLKRRLGWKSSGA